MDVWNDILAAVSGALDALWPHVPVYAEDVPEGLPERCFLIGFAGDAEVSRQVAGRRRLSGKLSITYLTPEAGASTETKRELNRVFAALALNLHTVEYQGMRLRLWEHSRKDDGGQGVLQDICTFQFFLFPVEGEPPIGTLDIRGSAEKEE